MSTKIEEPIGVAPAAGSTDRKPSDRRRLLALLGIAAFGLVILAAVQWARRPVPLRAMSVERLTNLLAEDEVTAAGAQEALEMRAEGSDVRFWRKLLSSPQARVRYLAIDAIARLRGPEPARILAGALADPDAKLRIEAVHALRDQNHDAGIRTALAALRDD